MRVFRLFLFAGSWYGLLMALIVCLGFRDSGFDFRLASEISGGHRFRTGKWGWWI